MVSRAALGRHPVAGAPGPETISGGAGGSLLGKAALLAVAFAAGGGTVAGQL